LREYLVKLITFSLCECIVFFSFFLDIMCECIVKNTNDILLYENSCIAINTNNMVLNTLKIIIKKTGIKMTLIDVTILLFFKIFNLYVCV
jgi:hypothetical protein